MVAAMDEEERNRSEEQQDDTQYMRGAVSRIAVIFHVIRKLAPKISIHACTPATLMHEEARQDDGHHDETLLDHQAPGRQGSS